MKFTGAEIRQSFIEYFQKKGHTFVPSSSLVPGGDQTLLFTNAGMVQFKDVFLGSDQRPYKRAVNSQKCMRVAGKHNDLDDVGRDDSHHTFFEMLGNWSFGDYYKKEAISWAWELLTEVWGVDKKRLWATVFKDDRGDIPTDEEAASLWLSQPGFEVDHLVYFGRKDNFWEMADTGPCGPCSEIHIDLGPGRCDKQDQPGHICSVNGDCKRFLEIWNLVFIQYNRISANDLRPLPACHVDTGMGFDRIVSLLQGVTSNYRTDLFFPLLEKTRELAGQTVEQMEANFTSYRVIADHARAVTFLIADGVVPGNTGRNYVCRMIIRRAARFGSKIGLDEPFLARIAEIVIKNYGSAYPELIRNERAILDSITREETRFKKTVESGISYLDQLLSEMKQKGMNTLDGKAAFDLYATHGLPLELTRDIAREQGLDVDETGFRAAMDEHRTASGAGKAFGPQGGEDADFFREIMDDLAARKRLPETGVENVPYSLSEDETKIAGLLRESILVDEVSEGNNVEVILPRTSFYIESGGQVSDTGSIVSAEPDRWEIKVEDVRKPVAGIVVHIGRVVKGNPRVGDGARALVDRERRRNITRNHTATHLLQAQLRKVLGEHVRQAGSSVTAEKLRFDFNHSEPVSPEQLEKVENEVNRTILQNFSLKIEIKPLSQAIAEGAMALFGEKYGEEVRSVAIGGDHPFSYELCGGTHVDETGDIGLFVITSEGSAAAGVRRIEAVTGWSAYELTRHRFDLLKKTAKILTCSVEETPIKVEDLLGQLDQAQKQSARLRQDMVANEFISALSDVPRVAGVPVLTKILSGADADNLRQMCDLFRQRYSTGIVVLGSEIAERPMLIVAVTDDLVKKGILANEMVKEIALSIGGSGGGRPNLAQAGGKDPAGLPLALTAAVEYVKVRL